MTGAALAALLLCSSAPQQAPELDAVLSTLEKRVEDFRDFRASFVYTYSTTDGRTKEKKAKNPFSGDLAYRAPGRAAWSIRVTDSSYEHQAYANWLDRKLGYRGAIDENEVRLHLPFGLHAPEDFGGLRPREHHGASWYRAPIDSHTPAPVPLLGLPPTFHPILFLYQLAPRAVLGRLPSIKVSGRKEEEGKRFIVLTSKPIDPADASRVDESKRRRDETWFGTEIWVDEAEGAIDRVIVTYEHSSAAPRFRRDIVFKYSRRVGGLATLIGHEWSQMEFANLRSNAGVKDEEARIDFPADAIVRDWVAQPQAVYDQRLQKDPADASAWLSLGTLRFRQQNYAAAVEAFKKVVELRPKAPEGYIACSYFLKEPGQAPAMLDFLEAAVKQGVNFPVVRLALAHGHHKNFRGDRALPHFEAVLKQVGEDLTILENMIYMAGWPTPAEGRRHYFRLFKAEIAQDEPTFGYTRWESPVPPPAELLELAKMYEDAFSSGATSPWMRKRSIDLYTGLKRPKDARRHAEALVALVEREQKPQTFGAADRALEFFVAEKDWAAAARLQKAYAAKTDDSMKKIAALYEVEIAGGRASMEALKELVDERIKPEWNPQEKLRFSPTYVRLIRVLQREKRSTEFAKKIVESIGDHDNRQLYIDIVESAVRDFHVPHVDGQALLVRLKEKTTGAQAGATDLVNLCRQYAWAKQWAAAMEKATEALARKDLTPAQRATAEGVSAECHVASGAFDPAVAACDRALELKDLRPLVRSELCELRARALLGAKKDRPAAEALGRSMSELFAEKNPEYRWRALKELRRKLPQVPRSALEEAAAARPDDGGLRLVLVQAFEREGQFAKAAAAMAEALKAWPGDAFLLRDLAILWARAEDPPKAIAARAAFLAAREKLQDALRGAQADDLVGVDHHIVSALEAKAEPAPLREFAVKLAGEPDPVRSITTLSRILVIVFDEAFIEKIHAALMAAASREDLRLNLRYPAAQALHEMGKTAKAVALYKDAAAGKGFSPPYARAAKEQIERFETEDKERTELLRWIRARLEKLPPGRRESEELQAIIRELSTSRNLWLLDRIWRNGLREKNPDPLFVKLAALRGSRGVERMRALEQLGSAAGASPDWRLQLAMVFLERGDLAKAVEVIREALQSSALPAKDREAFIRRGMSLVWSIPKENRADLGKDLASKGAYPWAWELREHFLQDLAARLDFAQRWRKAALGPEDRAQALGAVAETLLGLERPKEALDALNEALREKEIAPELRKRLEHQRLEPLVRFGAPAEAVPVVIGRLDQSPYLSFEARRWVSVIAEEKRGDEWLKLWEEAKPPGPSAVYFAATLELVLDRRDAALARLQEGAKKFPDHALIQRQLGDLYVRGNKHDLAADAYEKAVIHWQGSEGEAVYLRMQLALATGKAGKLKEAAEIIRAERNRPHRLSFVTIAEELKLYDLAADFYREALESRKDDLSLRTSLALTLQRAGKPAEAEVEFRILLKADGGKRVWALSGLMNSLIQKKDPAGIAQLLVDEAREAKEGLVGIQPVWGQFRSVPADLRPAVETEWRKLSPAADVEAVPLLTSLMFRHWHPDESPMTDDLQAALRRFPQSASLQYQAALALDHVDRWQEASVAYEKAMNLDPEGKRTGKGRPSMRSLALEAAMRAHANERALGLCLEHFQDFEPGMQGAADARRTLRELQLRMGESFWSELSRQRDRLPSPKAESMEQIRLLVRQLGDDEFDLREAAVKELKAVGVPALGMLAGVVESSDVDLRVRARNTVRAILRD